LEEENSREVEDFKTYNVFKKDMTETCRHLAEQLKT